MTVTTPTGVRFTDATVNLDVRDVSKQLFGHSIVRGFSLTLRPGQVHGLYGSSATAKTTVAQLLTGATAPDHGEVVSHGEVLDARSAQRRGVVLSGSLLPGRSVAGNIFLANEPRTDGRVDHARMEAEAADVLTVLGLAISPSARASELTPAERVLVECARALAAKTRVLVLDEPWSGLEPADAQLVRGTLALLARTGVSIVVLADDIVGLAEVCDGVAAL